jgi:hypothetical protein
LGRLDEPSGFDHRRAEDVAFLEAHISQPYADPMAGGACAATAGFGSRGFGESSPSLWPNEGLNDYAEDNTARIAEATIRAGARATASG